MTADTGIDPTPEEREPLRVRCSASDHAPHGTVEPACTSSRHKRDAERWVTEELSRALRLMPALRLGQLIVNVLPERFGNDPFYFEDNDLATAITQYIHFHVPCDIAKPGLCHFGKEHQGPCGRFVPAPTEKANV